MSKILCFPFILAALALGVLSMGIAMRGQVADLEEENAALRAAPVDTVHVTEFILGVGTDIATYVDAEPSPVEELDGSLVKVAKKFRGSLANHGRHRSETYVDALWDIAKRKQVDYEHGDRGVFAGESFFTLYFDYRIDSSWADTTCYKPETCEK